MKLFKNFVIIAYGSIGMLSNTTIHWIVTVTKTAVDLLCVSTGGMKPFRMLGS